MVLERPIRTFSPHAALRWIWLGVTALLLGAAPIAGALAQAFPARTVRLVVGAPPGGSTDLIARLLAARLQEEWKSPVIVENRPGAGGVVGASSVSKAAPDGYALLVGFTGQFLVNPTQQEKLPYDPLRDFEPVSMLSTGPLLLVANPTLPVNSVRELIEYAKTQPGALDHATGGSGFFYAAEYFQRQTGTELRSIPYIGMPAVVNAVLAGTVPLAFVDLPPAITLLRTGRLKALGATTARRLDALPDLPAIAETVPGYDYALWTALFAPAGLPADVLATLHRETVRAMDAQDLQAKMRAVGLQPSSSTPRELGEMVRRYVALVDAIAGGKAK